MFTGILIGFLGYMLVNFICNYVLKVLRMKSDISELKRQGKEVKVNYILVTVDVIENSTENRIGFVYPKERG